MLYRLARAAPCGCLREFRLSVMPLRAKLSPQAASMQRRPVSTNTEVIDELPGDEVDDVVFHQNYGVRTIQLNRPAKLNSLNGSMIRKIVPRLREWTNSQLAQVVVIKGVGRAFCAGGDIAALAKWNVEGEEGKQRSKDYFALEYKLDHLIATYPKPYVAFMDGITMGGGVGLSFHAPFRIATENTVFAMPETTIGFFPDVGASFFLPRLDGNFGTYLALTSERVRGVDALYHGLATHYVHSTALPDLEARLGELNFKDYLGFQARAQLVNATIEEYVSPLPAQKAAISGEHLALINTIFDPQRSLTDILSDLKDQSDHATLGEWARKTIDTLRHRSPTSVAVALKLMQTGKTWDIARAFRREHAIASKFMEHPDFIEGVTEQLLKKGDAKKARPDWQPGSLEEVAESGVEDFFAGEDTLKLLNSDSALRYTQYPHAWTGLPAEDEVMQVLENGATDAGKVLMDMVHKYNGKQGVKEKVIEILERRRQISDDGTIRSPEEAGSA